MTSPATTGWTAKMLADYLALYADKYPNAKVMFLSSESGGYWPKTREAMGVFIDEQVHQVHDLQSLHEGNPTLEIALMTFPKPVKA